MYDFFQYLPYVEINKSIYNTDNNKAFSDLCCAMRFKGALDLSLHPEDESQTPLRWYWQAAHYVIHHLLRMPFVKPNRPTIYFGIINSDGINGFATPPNNLNISYVGLTSGAIRIFRNAAFQLMCDPAMLSHIIRDSCFENINRAKTYGLITKADQIPLAGSPLPLTARRYEAAYIIWEHACRYLLMHEIGHVLLGHVTYLQKTNAYNLGLAENTPSNGDENRLTRQALELQADMYAGSNAVLNLIQDVHALPVEQRSSYILSRHSDLVLLCCGIYLTMRLIESAIPDWSQISRSTHPPMRFRYLNGLRQTFIYFLAMCGLDDNHKDAEQLFHYFAETLQFTRQSVEQSFSRLASVEMISEDIYSQNSEFVHYTESLVLQLNKLESELVTFSYIDSSRMKNFSNWKDVPQYAVEAAIRAGVVVKA